MRNKSPMRRTVSNDKDGQLWEGWFLLRRMVTYEVDMSAVSAEGEDAREELELFAEQRSTVHPSRIHWLHARHLTHRHSLDASCIKQAPLYHSLHTGWKRPRGHPSTTWSNQLNTDREKPASSHWTGLRKGRPWGTRRHCQATRPSGG